MSVVKADPSSTVLHNTMRLDADQQAFAALGLGVPREVTFAAPAVPACCETHEQTALSGQMCGNTPDRQLGRHVEHWRGPDCKDFSSWCRLTRAYAACRTTEEVDQLLATQPAETMAALGNTRAEEYATMERVWAGLGAAEVADGSTFCNHRGFRGPLQGEFAQFVP